MNLPELETENQKKLHRTSIFILKLLLLGLLFRGIIALSPDTTSFQVLLAQVTEPITELAGVTLERQGALLYGERGAYLITQDCLGWKSVAAYIGLVIASAEKIRETWKPLAAGILALIAANIIRIATTIYLSHQGIISFEIIHSVFWKWGLTAIVFVAWLAFLRKKG